MLKILWKRGEIAPEDQFLLLSIIFCYLVLDFYVKTRIRFSLRDKRLFEITEVEITRVDCNLLELQIRKVFDFLVAKNGLWPLRRLLSELLWHQNMLWPLVKITSFRIKIYFVTFYKNCLGKWFY